MEEITERDGFNEFTGDARESILPPPPTEPICLISYEVTVILLGEGPQFRSSFWRSYRREVELNQKTNFQNYHVHLCREQLVSLGMKVDGPVFFVDGRLAYGPQKDAITIKALANPKFLYRTENTYLTRGNAPVRSMPKSRISADPNAQGNVKR